MRLIYCLLLLPFLVLSLSASAGAARTEALAGGWNPIEDIGDPYVAEIAKFAVTEYDKRPGAKLELEKVIKGEYQVVAGTNYRLVVAAKNGSATENYEALVYDRPWQHYRNLTSFEPVR